MLRARFQPAWTDKDHEKGGGFDGILHMELLSDDDVDLSVSGVEITEGEGPEGKRESNRCTYFSHVRPCTLPAIGELPCRASRSSLEDRVAISGRCKTRAKMSRPIAAFCPQVIAGVTTLRAQMLGTRGQSRRAG